MQSTHNLAVVQRVTPTKQIDDPKQAIAAIVAGLQASDPRADENALAFRLMEKLESDPQLLQAAAIVLVHATMVLRRAVQQADRHRTPAARAHRREEVAALVVKAKAKLLDVVMPMNGKALRFCLSSECASWGGGFARLAAAVPPARMLGECLTDHEAAELFDG